MRNTTLRSALAFVVAGTAHTMAMAVPTTFTGFDANGNPNVALSSTPNSDAARNAFFSNLQGVGTETFETRSGSGPLAIDFGAAGTATLTGPGSVATTAAGTTNGAGRYSVPSATSTNYWQASAGVGGIVVTFSNAIAAFGFYGIDLGDFNGTLTLELTSTTNAVTSLSVPTAPQNVADGSVLYFGFFDTTTQYKQVTFSTTGGSGDIFAFDNFSIGSVEQVRPVPVPLPGSLALVGLGLAGLGLTRRRARA